MFQVRVESGKVLQSENHYIEWAKIWKNTEPMANPAVVIKEMSFTIHGTSFWHPCHTFLMWLLNAPSHSHGSWWKEQSCGTDWTGWVFPRVQWEHATPSIFRRSDVQCFCIRWCYFGSCLISLSGWISPKKVIIEKKTAVHLFHL